MNFILLLRDILKFLREKYYWLAARLFYVKRGRRTWIHTSARLDIIPSRQHKTTYPLCMREKSMIEAGCVINTRHGPVTLEQYCGIGIGSIVIGPVSFGKHTTISQYCFITGENRAYEDVSKSLDQTGYTVKEIIIRNNVWIGSFCVILPGVVIGEHAVVAGGSVVTKNIPDYCLAAGNPAKIIKQYDHQKKMWLKV